VFFIVYKTTKGHTSNSSAKEMVNLFSNLPYVYFPFTANGQNIKMDMDGIEKTEFTYMIASNIE